MGSNKIALKNIAVCTNGLSEEVVIYKGPRLVDQMRVTGSFNLDKWLFGECDPFTLGCTVKYKGLTVQPNALESFVTGGYRG